jgi:hypothetical protein
VKQRRMKDERPANIFGDLHFLPFLIHKSGGRKNWFTGSLQKFERKERVEKVEKGVITGCFCVRYVCSMDDFVHSARTWSWQRGLERVTGFDTISPWRVAAAFNGHSATFVTAVNVKRITRHFETLQSTSYGPSTSIRKNCFK